MPASFPVTVAPQADLLQHFLTDEASKLMVSRLVMSLQIIQSLDPDFEAAYQVSQQPATAEMIEDVSAQDMNGL